jgi:GntR family transcriptional regulator
MQHSSPRYHQIADELRTRIVSGELQAGSQLPAEQDLQTHYSVSRNTVRLALKRLTDEGLLVSGQGRGTFVRASYEPFVWNWTTLESRSQHARNHSVGHDQWAAAVLATGRTPRQEVHVSLVTPPSSIARRLGLDRATTVLVRHRVRYVNAEPYLLSDSYFPAELVQGTPLMEPRDVSAPGGVLASLGLIQVRYHDEMTVRMPTRTETERLNLPAATPVAEHMRTGYDEENRALRVMVTVLPGDRHVLTYDVSAD